ncbi:KN motif and ankyrin repeat domain-containing protein 3 isoform X1 [Euwallacea similis]|uniref:KN motif and ankyrin repeat domain-containing protein 3 isoform X1 n=1 Tax=Euwallacea similis TaxID=1736056 RepID=UPI00344EEFC2
MSYSKYRPNVSPIRSLDNGYICWYDECTCCPYGYHIDLDFVRYCESISKEDKTRTGSIKRRKDRRKQRHSMEVLLGLSTPVLSSLNDGHAKLSYVPETSSKPVQKPQEVQHFRFNEGFDNAVSDFERALQRSKNHQLSNNLPDVTAVSVSASPALSSNQDGSLKPEFDMVSIESCGLSPTALQNIREALALSLDRMKQLEFQVKLIPELQDELAHLRVENRRLLHELKSSESNKLHSLNGNYTNVPSEFNIKRSHSFTYPENEEIVKKESSPSPLPRKDCGVMCGVLTRNIGVGHQYPNTRDVSTITSEFADKWLPEKAKFLNTLPLTSPKICITKGTQTFLGKEKRDMGIQISLNEPKKVSLGIQASVPEPKKVTLDGFTQTDAIKVSRKDVGVQKIVESVTVGSSNHTIDETICDKCNTFNKKTDTVLDGHSLSLASLGHKSKSFHLDGKLELKKKSRSVASQCDVCQLFKSDKSAQVEVATRSKSTQHEIKSAEKSVQYERNTLSKYTNTKDLNQPEPERKRPETVDRASSPHSFAEEKETSEEKVFERFISKEIDNRKETPSSPTPSRIPIPTTPVEARKFRRQDTYTKVYATSPTEKNPVFPEKLSGLDLTPKAASTESVSPFDKVKQNLKLDVPGSAFSSKSQSQKIPTQERTLPVSESTIFQTPSQNRKKATPSKEMQGALKVLNDALQKSPSRAVKNHSAINIVQQEWFKISSLVTANPLDVEDYLDAFEDMSSVLLQYVVNMTDISGNTAMHYAVSHGNFDVVSILLDSKVCDINKPNKAGYTSVMLVSLAEVKSQTHANVVKRLFQLADVNIRAAQHGQTALMLAVSHGRLDMVKMLLEAGADINIQDEDGSTALMCAAEHGHIEIVKHFLSQPDCDSSITDVDGSTALKIAMEASHRHIGVLLYAHERNIQKLQSAKLKKINSNSPKTPSSPLPIRSSHRALTDTKK